MPPSRCASCPSPKSDGPPWSGRDRRPITTRRNVSAVAADEPIRIVAYDPAWPALYEAERAQLGSAIGNLAPGGIHHVGSTAVRGLEAKPIIDILAGVGSLEGSRACFEHLAELRYVYAPYRSEEMHWFCKPDPGHRTHHLHLVPADSTRFREELAFRDFLRAHADVAREYGHLKRALAQRFRHDREAYTDAKSGFVRDVLEQAAGEVSRWSRPSPAGSSG